jgi:agmatine deiminase
MARTMAAAAILGLCGCAMAQPLVNPPEGTDVPRSLTAEERAWLAEHPILPSEAATPAPTGPVRCVGEYEPMEALLVSWDGSTSQNTILQAIAKEVTTRGGSMYVAVDSTGEQGTVTTSLTAAGVVMSRVKFVVTTTDSIWIRDYGPRYIYQGNVRAIVDHTYNRPRPNDDLFPVAFARNRGHARYEMALTHGGGNYHLSGLGDSYATKLIGNENPTLTQPQIIQLWKDYQNVDTHLFDPFPTNVDSTQHIDMWMQIIGDRKVVVSDWDANRGSTQDTICNAAAAYMASQGYTVARTPARLSGGVHYTYANMVVFNDLVLVPRYSAIADTIDEQARAAIAALVPGKTIVQITGDSLATSAGVFHCVAMHVPANKNGTIPGVYITSMRDNPTLTPGASATIGWASDDDVAPTKIDLYLSTDGGGTFDQTIALNRPPVNSGSNVGSFAWTVPQVFAPDAVVRAVVTDASGNTSTDEVPVYINGVPCTADVTRDGQVDFGDFLGFFNCYDVGEGPGSACADLDGNPGVDFGDFLAFFNGYDAGC